MPGLFFDEEQYTEEGIKFTLEDDYFYLHNDNAMISLHGDELHFRSSATTDHSNLWPLEFSVNGEHYAPVFDGAGQYKLGFLNGEALKSQHTPPSGIANFLPEEPLRPRNK